MQASPHLVRGSWFQRFLAGARYALSGLGIVLGSPGLWPYYIAPMLLTAVLLTSGAALAWFGIPWVANMVWTPTPGVPVLLAAGWWAAMWLLRATAVLMLGIVLYFAAGLLALPFNDRLSERVETRLLGPYEEPFSLRVVVGDMALSVAHSTVSLVLWLGVLLLLFLLNGIPLLGTVLNVAGWLLATSLFLSREMMDGCMSRRRMGFNHKAHVVLAHLPVMFGFGSVVTIALWVPGLNFVAMPMAVAAGTRLFCDLERLGAVPEADGRPGFTSDRLRVNALADRGPAFKEVRCVREHTRVDSTAT